MWLFDIFRTPTPDDLAAELIRVATKVEISPDEADILTKSSIDINRYTDERLMMQIWYSESFLHNIAQRTKNQFFRDALKSCDKQFQEFSKANMYFGFSDINELHNHQKAYYTLNLPEHILNMVFHALRHQTLVRTNKIAHRVFEKSFGIFFNGVRDVIVIHLKRENLKFFSSQKFGNRE